MVVKKVRAVRLFLDTNILIDVAANRQPWVREALILLELARQGKVTLVATDYSFLNIAYVTRKLYSREELKALLKNLLRYVEVVEVGRDMVIEALEGAWKDMEDHVQSLVARREAADFIITRNEKDFVLSEVQVLSPSAFLDMVL